MTRFADKTYLVTGASSGIGKACAQRLAAEGAAVVLWGRDRARLQQAVAEIGERARMAIVDLTQEQEVKDALLDIKRAGVGLAGIVHAAGAHAMRPLALEQPDKLSALLEANVGSVFRATRLALASGLLASGGTITIVSSQAATRGTGGASAYAATKGAIEAATRSWAVELSRRGLRVNAVAPGVVKTPMTDRLFAVLPPAQREQIEAHHLLGLGEPADVAAVVAFLASADARWMTGAVINVDGGFSAW